MIGRPHWFKYRTLGWGIAPKTWQGWVYILVAILLIAGTFALGIKESTKMWIFSVLLVILVADVIVIMTKLPRVSDERENMHQLIIERNCSFAAIVALIGVALYQTYKTTGFVMTQNGGPIPFDISIVIVLGAMLATKVISTIYVKTKM